MDFHFSLHQGRRAWKLGLVMGLALLAGGCALTERAGIGLFYRNTPLPQQQKVENIAYTARDDPDPQHRLDLYLPKGTNWPVLIFVHGGGWTSGDKNLSVAGADVYGNIGRFYASRGIGVAVINYRLQPYATWRDQVRDVTQATVWVYSNIGQYGGNPQRIFLFGHSAGAQLIAHVGLNPKNLEAEGVSPRIIAGVITVSGAGLDLADQETYALGQKMPYYEECFHAAAGEDWRRDASPITYIQSSAPPFLILVGSSDLPGLQRQSELLRQALSDLGVENQLIVVPRQSHARIVLTLSRPDKTAGPAILEFIKAHR